MRDGDLNDSVAPGDMVDSFLAKDDAATKNSVMTG